MVEALINGLCCWWDSVMETLDVWFEKAVDQDNSFCSLSTTPISPSSINSTNTDHFYKYKCIGRNSPI